MIAQHIVLIGPNAHRGVTLLVEITRRDIRLAERFAIHQHMAIANTHFITRQSDHAFDVGLGLIERIAENHHVTPLDGPEAVEKLIDENPLVVFEAGHHAGSKHPEYFNSFGGSIWRGRIYTASKFGVLLRRPIIYRGLFGSAGFQSLYASEPALTLMFCTTLEYHLLVTLPLWILSPIFHPLLPLAITSLLLSLGVCVAAGAQAALPKTKARRWSRPLVALLFFLQPMVRGWARYQGRLMLRPPPVAQPTLDAVALCEGWQSLREVTYWSHEPVNRLALVAEILWRLGQQGWPNKSDIGWSDYDVEIYGSRWSNLQLTTVTEEHGRNKHLIRCRLRARWSLPAKVAFWLAGGFELLVLGFVGKQLPWLWLLLLTLPLFAWYIHREQRHLRSLLVVFLDDLARDWKLSRPQSAGEAESVGPLESVEAVKR